MDLNSGTSLDIEREKKRNTRLALGVAAIGVLFFALIYAVFFALMFLSPGFFFGMMPFPALSKELVGVGDKLYVISKEVDMSGDFGVKPSKYILWLKRKLDLLH